MGLSKHPAVKACLVAGLPQYQAFLTRKQPLEKAAWLEKKKEEIVTTFGGRELAKYSAEDIRKVRAYCHFYNGI